MEKSQSHFLMPLGESFSTEWRRKICIGWRKTLYLQEINELMIQLSQAKVEGYKDIGLKGYENNLKISILDYSS